MFYRSIGKRIVDLILGATLFLLATPLMVIVGGAALLVQGRPVLFRQRRPGFAGKPFQIVKFRTMRTALSTASSSTDEERLTALGRTLRRTSLDELPELWNVIRGDMSLVGPRPLLMEYLDRYSPRQARRHEVRPGITGWAQVNGRNAIAWKEKLELDVWYVDHLSVALDVKILCSTVWKVLRGESVSAPGTPPHPRSKAAPMTDRAGPGTEPIAILGAGGHGKVVLATALAAGFRVGGVFDDAPDAGVALLGVALSGRLARAAELGLRHAVLAIGSNETRRRLASTLPHEWVSVIHPRAWVHDSAVVGPGAMVLAGALIQPEAVIGAHVIVNTGASIDHDCRIGDFVHIAPGVRLAGGVIVGDGVLLGIGCSVIPGVAIGSGAVVGAGAAVVANVAAGETVGGVPARKL